MTLGAEDPNHISVVFILNALSPVPSPHSPLLKKKKKDFNLVQKIRNVNSLTLFRHIFVFVFSR